VAVWTWALLVPNPDQWASALILGNEPDSGAHDSVGQQILSVLDSYLFSKALHISAYAVLAVLSGWVGCGRIRWALLAFMSLHALGSEFLQSFEPSRHPSWDDVGFDHIGIGMGMVLSWKWWTRGFSQKPGQ
jgi:hypothetical protein